MFVVVPKDFATPLAPPSAAHCPEHVCGITGHYRTIRRRSSEVVWPDLFLLFPSKGDAEGSLTGFLDEIWYHKSVI